MVEQFDIPPSTTTTATGSQPAAASSSGPSAGKGGSKIVGVLIIIAVVGLLGVVLVRKNLPSRSTDQIIAASDDYAGWKVGSSEGAEVKKSLGQMDADRGAWMSQNKAILTKLDEVVSTQREQSRRLNRLESQAGELVSRGQVSESVTVDSSALPEGLRPLFTPATEFLAKLAVDRGVYGYDAVKPFLAEWGTQQNHPLNEGESKLLYEAAQIQREPLPDELTDTIPGLVRKRSAMRIARGDVSGIAKMVWSERENLPPFTPGQYASLIALVGKSGDVVTAGSAQISDGIALPDRKVSLGFQTIAASDLPATAAAASPYLAGSLADASQNAGMTAFLTTRARAMAMGYVQRDLPLARSLISVAKEEATRFTRYHVPEVAVAGDELDLAVRGFMGQVAAGLAIGRAQREGVVDPERIKRWATDIAAGIPTTVGHGMDLRNIVASYAVLVVRDPLVPTLPPNVIDALDLSLRPAIAKHRENIPEKDRQAYVAAAAVHGVAAAILASREAIDPTKEQIGAAVIRAVDLTAIGVQASVLTMKTVEEEMIPSFATLFEGAQQRDWTRLPAEARVQVERAVNEGLKDAPAGAPNTDLLAQVAGGATRNLEGWIAQLAAIDMCNGEIDRVAATAAMPLVKAAREYAAGRIRRQIVPPLSRDRVVQLTYVIARDALAIVNGRKRLPEQRQLSTTASTSLPTRPIADRSDPSAGEVPERSPIRPAGISFLLSDSDNRPVARRTVVIPAGTYGEARTLTGVVCELGDKTPREMLLHLDYSWKGPGDTTYVMRNMSIICSCVAMGGAPRVYVLIDKVAVTLPDKRSIVVPAQGWVVENGHGTTGILGEWDLQLFDKVIPLAATSGFFEAIAAAFKANTEVSVNVNQQTTVTQTDDRSAGQKAVSGAAGETTRQVAGFTNRVMASINPFLTVPNNQAVVAVLHNSVDLEIPLEDWDAIVEEHAGSSAGGFAH